MRVGDIKKINKVYADSVEEADLEGVEVRILGYDKEKLFPVEAEILSGKYAEKSWIFTEDELS